MVARAHKTELLDARLEGGGFQPQASGSAVLAPDAPSSVVQYLQDVRPFKRGEPKRRRRSGTAPVDALFISVAEPQNCRIFEATADQHQANGQSV